jgi:hypothetical protein
MYEALYGLMKYTKPFHHLFSFHVYEFSNEDAQQDARLELSLDKTTPLSPITLALLGSIFKISS